LRLLPTDLDSLADEMHSAFRWICGGVGVNYHVLSDFRVEDEKALEGLMAQVLAARSDCPSRSQERLPGETLTPQTSRLSCPCNLWTGEHE